MAAVKEGELLAEISEESNFQERGGLYRVNRTLRVLRMGDGSHDLYVRRHVVGQDDTEGVERFDSFHALYERVALNCGRTTSDALIDALVSRKTK
jgi:hypothetical protein